MGDEFNFKDSQVGAAGKKASATGNVFNQQRVGNDEIDTAMLLADLAKIVTSMRTEAFTAAKPDPEQVKALGQVMQAQEAAEAGEPSRALEILKTVGKFALDFASKVGASYVAKLITG